MLPKKIISGGQTGADRAALDFAISRGIEYGGIIPKGRRAEDGRIPDSYKGLSEAGSPDYEYRTQQNVSLSDGTIILYHNQITGGTLKTSRFADDIGKPCLSIDLGIHTPESAALSAGKFLRKERVEILNIAGPRASEDPEIYGTTLEFLSRLFDN